MTPNGDTVRVLHVDDEPEFAETAAAFLTEENDRFQVETAANAAEGLERLEASGFDCIVSDYDMPGRNGIEFLRAVREAYPELPLILFTGKGSEEVASDAISAGVTDYVQKGVSTDQYTILANRIHNAVSANRSANESKRRRRRLEQILKTVPSCVVQLDREGRFIFANQRAVDVLGLEQSALTDRTYNDPEWEIRDLDGEPIPDAELPFRQVADTGEPVYNRRHTIRWDDGTEKVLSVNGAPFFDEDGAIESVVCTLTDITDQHERKRDLRETERRLQLALRATETGVWEWNRQTGAVTWSETLERIMGYAPGEFPGTVDAFMDLVHPEDREAVREALNEAVETDSIYSTEFRMFDADGDVQWVSVRGQPVEHDGEELVVGVHHDITERKERERELETMQRRLDAILENTTTPMFMKDAEGRLLFVNHGYRELFGLEDEEIIGNTDHDLFPEAMADAVQANDQTVIQTGEPLEAEEEIVVDGETRRYLSTKVPIYDTGEEADPDEPVAVFGVASDITDIREKERALQRERDRLDEFASVVSHDLRGPIAVAQGQVGLARMNGEERHLDRIEAALDRMERIIEDVLLLAREGRDIGETEPVALEDAVADAWEVISEESSEQTLVFAGDRDVTLMADRARLLQLLENLLRNAVEHGVTSAQGDCSVAVTVGTTADGFYVADDGPGIPESKREAVFEAGHSGEDAGSGFGLAIVERIAEAHDWSVSVRESADGGARFDVTGVEFA